MGLIDKKNQKVTAKKIALIAIAGILAFLLGGSIRFIQDKITSNTSSATVATTPSQNTTSKPLVCAENDFKCLVAAAQNCSTSIMEYQQTYGGWGTLIFSAKFSLNKSDTPGNCHLLEYIDSLSLNTTTQAEQTAKSQGATDNKLKQQLQTGQAELASMQQQTPIGTTIDCDSPTDNIVTALTTFLNGKPSTNSLSSGQCTKIMPNGTKIKLYENW